LTPAAVRRCLKAADGLDVSQRWDRGDCDGDGCPNGLDPALCNSQYGCNLPSDAGVSGDASVATDAMLLESDSSTSDAGPPDGSTRHEDSGIQLDASKTEATAISFRGQGGLKCSYSGLGSGGPHTLGTWLAFALAIALGRFRRTRRTRERRCE